MILRLYQIPRLPRYTLISSSSQQLVASSARRNVPDFISTWNRSYSGYSELSPTSAEMSDLSNSIAAIYDRGNRGIPRLFARYITGLAPKVENTSVIHDNACGPGTVTSELLSRISPGTIPSITATDISPDMIAGAEETIQANNWNHVTTAVMNSQKFSFEDETFTHSFTNFLVPNHPSVASEIHRTLKHGGTAIFTVWEFHGFADLMRRCSNSVHNSDDPGPLADQWFTEDRLRDQFEAAGFQKHDIRVHSHCEYVQFKDLDDLIHFSTGSFCRSFARDWSEEDIQMIADVVKQSLTADEIDRKSIRMVGWILEAKKT